MCHFHIVCILQFKGSQGRVLEEGLFNRGGSRRVHCSEGSDSDDEYEDDYTGDCSSDGNLVNDDDNLRLLYVEQWLRELMAQELNEIDGHVLVSSSLLPLFASLSLLSGERERELCHA